MTQVSDFVAIDMGNTQIKIAHFFQKKIQKVDRISISELISHPESIQNITNLSGIYCSVRSKEDNMAIEKLFPFIKNVENFQKLPIKNDYKSSTLGWDRLINAIATNHLAKTAASLAIDIGTCIKFDLVVDNHYKGGSISPGLRLRFTSLNQLTANLPYADDYSPVEYLADNTIDAIRSGVINGAQGEINHFIRRYTEEYPSLTIFVTGGDAQYFDIESKNNIFVDENLTFIGLYQIYTFNV